MSGFHGKNNFLQPFGGRGQSLEDVFANAQIRARAQLAQWRSRQSRPEPLKVERHFGGTEIGTFFLAALCFLPVAMLVNELLVRPQRGLVLLALIFTCIGLGIFLAGWFHAYRRVPLTPQDALKYYYAALKERNFKRAAQLVCPVDYDGSLRANPERLAEGEFVPMESKLAGPHDFMRYWKEVAKPLRMQVIRLTVKESKFHQIAEDLCLAEITLECITPSLLSVITIFLGVLMSNRREWTVRRLLIRNQDQWLMWSAEWWALSEIDPSWTRPAENAAGETPKAS